MKNYLSQIKKIISVRNKILILDLEEKMSIITQFSKDEYSNEESKSIFYHIS